MQGVLALSSMELTPKVFRDVQFREKLRGGYHPEDVDEFLEQAAVGVEALQDQLRQATERAQRAEQAATEASATDETLKRMLLMAQRTADQAVNEARQEADRSLADARQEAERLVGDARQEADRVLSGARSQAESMLADAEERGRRAYESGLAEGRASMERTDQALRQAQQEVEALRNWVEVQKPHILEVLRDAQEMVEKATLEGEPPQVTVNMSEVLGEEGEHFSGAAVDDSAYEGAHAEENKDSTGQWDPKYLEGIDGGDSANAPAANDGEPFAPGASYGSDPGQATGQTRSLAAEGRARQGEDTVAFDERALDSFFSDQDLGQARGLGRFRRRQ
jgi:DivIVA domain-containing protein